MIDSLTILIVLFAFAPAALRHFAPESVERPALYHVLAACQIAASLCFFVVLPLQQFLMFWAMLPAAFGAWHFWRFARARRGHSSRRLAAGE